MSCSLTAIRAALRLLQNFQEPPYYAIGIFKALGGVKVLDNHYSMGTKETVSLMVLGGA